MKDVFNKVVDTDGGRHLLSAELEIEFGDGIFSVMGNIDFMRESMGGQCLEDMADLLARNGLTCEKLNAIIPIWKRYHLNDVRPGSPRQMEVVRERKENGLPCDYDTMCKVLEEKGIYKDEAFVYHGHPYVYGEAWLKEEIPSDVANEIRRIMSMEFKVENRNEK